MKFLLLIVNLVRARSVESVLRCWECETDLALHHFECDDINKGRSVDCTSTRAGLEPVCVAWIRTEEASSPPPNIWLKKFCSWVDASKIGDATEKYDTHPEDSEKTVCWCKSKDNCNQEGILDQGKVGKGSCSGAESASSPPTLLVLLTFGIIIIQLGKLSFFLPLLLIGMVATNGFPVGSEGAQRQLYCRLHRKLPCCLVLLQ